jgi:4-cresol dehydrogenase (hydroxylating)
MAINPVSGNALSRAVEAFTALLGTEHVLVGEPAHRDEFRDPYQPASWDTYLASAVVLPESTEEVQAIVRIANEHRVPLWTHSTGRNNGYGGAAPGYPGAVLVSLRRMNRVLEINEELAYVVVEPGVTWYDLYTAITAGGHRLMMTNTTLGWGSVIGNTLEHGVTFGPMGHDYRAPCGLEVVTPEGDLLRTGMGAMSNNPAWHVYKRSFGPSIDTLFMQSNLGIVTKMGFWLLPAPESFVYVAGRVWNDDDLAPLADVARRLLMERTLEGVPGIRNTLLVASGLATRQDFYDGEGPIPEPVIARMARELEIGRWSFQAGLYGHEAQVNMQFERTKAAIEGAIPGAEIWGKKVAFDEIPTLEDPNELVFGGVPNRPLVDADGWGSGIQDGHVDFSSIVPLVGADVLSVHKMMRAVLERDARLDYCASSNLINPRTSINIGLIGFDASDEVVTTRTMDTLKNMVASAAERGYAEYRAHIAHMDAIADHFDFNDHAYRRFIEKLKDAVDPNGILSPGKQGIWPAHLRDS